MFKFQLYFYYIIYTISVLFFYYLLCLMYVAKATHQLHPVHAAVQPLLNQLQTI